jgi:hypothetical protein
MKAPAHPMPLNTTQIRLVLELLDTRLLAPKETAARFYQLSQANAFSEGQQEAVELLFELDDDEIAEALLAFADDEARDLVRAQLPHEAHLSFVAA